MDLAKTKLPSYHQTVLEECSNFPEDNVQCQSSRSLKDFIIFYTDVILGVKRNNYQPILKISTLHHHFPSLAIFFFFEDPPPSLIDDQHPLSSPQQYRHSLAFLLLCSWGITSSIPLRPLPPPQSLNWQDNHTWVTGI